MNWNDKEVTLCGSPPKPASLKEMQRGLAEYMGFTVGTKVRLVAKVEQANGVMAWWAAGAMDKLLVERAVGVVERVTASGHILVRFDVSGPWAFLPQCFEHASPQPATVTLNSSYTATVSPKSSMIAVGCQNISIEAVREVVKVWEELNSVSAVK